MDQSEVSNVSQPTRPFTHHRLVAYQHALASAGECDAVMDLLDLEAIEAMAGSRGARGLLAETAALTVGLLRRL